MKTTLFRMPNVWGMAFVVSCLGVISTAHLFVLPFLFVAGAWMVVRIVGLEMRLLLLSALLLPFTLDVSFLGGRHLVGLPGEALLVLLSLCFSWHWLTHGKRAHRLFHPLVLAIIFMWFCLLWSSFFSTDPIVSLKAVIIQTIFIFSGFGMVAQFVVSNEVNLFRLLQNLLVGLMLVSVYGLFHYATSDAITRSTSHMGRPFYKDHTIFSAVQCLALPLMVWYRSHMVSTLHKRFFTLLMGMCLLAVFVAASRAAWLSLIFAGVLWMGCLLRLRSFGFLAVAFLLIPIVALSIRPIERWALSNRNDSSRFQSSIKEQALSVGNITSDVSNLERLNRWKCAWRMAQDRPLTGFGPGTYQVAYLPYQRYSEMTRISVVSPFYIKDGKGGTAHSEYLLMLAEAGWPGLCAWLLLTVAACYTAHRLSLRFVDGPLRTFRIAIMMGLATFWMHALFNNFLTTANFAWPFWVLLASLFCLSSTPADFMEQQYFRWRENK